MKELLLVLLLALPRVDDIVAKYAKKDEPGCAFGVAANGEVITRAFGMANLEYDIPLTPDSIFESGGYDGSASVRDDFSMSSGTARLERLHFTRVK